MREVFRTENKYLLSLTQFKSLDNRLDKTLQQDKNNNNGEGYRVRSLYFDTPAEQDFYDKEDGIELRKKVRLRIYDPSAEFAFLELKQKEGAYQKKRSLKLSRQDAQQLMRGRYSCLLSYNDPFAAECYGLMNRLCYRPKSVVEYKRKAFIADENSTRITFDHDIIASEANLDIFSSSLMMYPVMDKYLTVMEVKYNGFLLSYIKDIISISKSPLSVSKYALSRSVGLHYNF